MENDIIISTLIIGYITQPILMANNEKLVTDPTCIISASPV